MSKRLQLPAIYPITDLRLASATCHAQIVETLAGEGAGLIQIREKTLSTRAFYLSAARSVAAARRHETRIIINDDLGICLATEADGIHLGGEDLPPEIARKVIGPSGIIGVSSHSVEEALDLSKAPVDYVAIGPIFPTSTKPTTRIPIGPEGIARLRSRIDKPIVAIGGIDDRNMKAVLEAGADSVAMISAIMTAENPGERYRRLMARIRHDE
ncbi:thiamine phosphate synthase [Acidobacteriota bacterium]